jgi:hypothetical protein
MITSLQTFISGVDELVSFLVESEQEIQLNNILIDSGFDLGEHAKHLLSSISASRTNRKRFTYIVSIVYLYGLLEQFVDTLIERYISSISLSVESYFDLPEKIINGHISLSADLIKAMDKDRHRDSSKKEAVIKNLHLCLSGDTEFRVNSEAFIIHRGNINLDKIKDYLSSVGIDSHDRRVVSSKKMINYYAAAEPGRDVKRAADHELRSLLSPVDELVDRRNLVAHGVNDDLESINILKERCKFIMSYGESLYDLLVQESLKIHVLSHDTVDLGRPAKVYGDGIACFRIGNVNICVGDTIVAETKDNMQPFMYGTISNLRTGDTDIHQIGSQEITEFCAKMTFKTSDRHKYYVIRRPLNIVATDLRS